MRLMLALVVVVGPGVMAVHAAGPWTSEPAPCYPCPTPPAAAAPGGAAPTAPSPAPPSSLPSDSAAADAGSQAQAGEAGTGAAGSFVTNMFGDLLGPVGTRTIFRTVTVPTATGGTITKTVPVTIRVPVIATATAFKISENESPRPVDRIFFNYNYFNDVNRSLNSSQTPNFDVHGETIGFEKTFLDGSGSFGMRAPVLQLAGDGSVSASDFGSISLIFKYAVYDDRQTGNLISTGMVLTLPTGPSFTIPGQSDLNPTLFQPYVGYIWNWDQFFIQGFSALIVPSDARDVTLLTNDLALGYNLPLGGDPDRLLTGLAPTIEAHVNTPLNHRGADTQPLGFPDTVDLTAGVRFFFGRKGSSLGIAVSIPVTGPRLDAYEGLAQLNIRF